MKTLDQLIEEQLSLPAVLPDARLEFGSIPGVVGVGLGFRTRAGELSDEISLRVYVQRKRPLDEIPLRERIPRIYGGIPTDVQLYLAARSLVSCQFDRNQLNKKASTLVGGLLISDRDEVDIQALQDGIAAGTLGCFATLKSDPSVRVLLTNHHVLYEKPTDSGEGLLVGQPDITCSWCCKTGVIGRTMNGVNDDSVDCAIAKLNKKRSPVQKLLGVGKDVKGRNEDLITGVPKTVVVAGVRTAVLVGEPVRKVGRSTGPTGGVVFAIDEPLIVREGTPNQLTMQNQIIIRPDACGDVLGDGSLNFALAGDSGAVLINRFNQVVGLIHKARDFKGQSNNQAPWRFWAAACHIHNVIDKLGIDIMTSQGAITKDTPEFPTPLPPPPTPTGALLPGMGLVVHRLTEEERVRGGVLEQIIAALESSRMGNEILKLYDTHYTEVRQLVNHDRKVKVVWHRSSGPAFVAALLGGMRDLAQPIPKEVNGFPIRLMIDRMVDVLRERGSASLSAAVRGRLTVALELLENSKTIADLLAQVGASGGDR